MSPYLTLGAKELKMSSKMKMANTLNTHDHAWWRYVMELSHDSLARSVIFDIRKPPKFTDKESTLKRKF